MDFISVIKQTMNESFDNFANDFFDNLINNINTASNEEIDEMLILCQESIIQAYNYLNTLDPKVNKGESPYDIWQYSLLVAAMLSNDDMAMNLSDDIDCFMAKWEVTKEVTDTIFNNSLLGEILLKPKVKINLAQECNDFFDYINSLDYTDNGLFGRKRMNKLINEKKSELQGKLAQMLFNIEGALNR
ncbi:MAG: hypothetical protein E7254_10735 [Lachnospiraceae bacterium]|nr:hypothetical protein [Lachnospiraceae bacterium]